MRNNIVSALLASMVAAVFMFVPFGTEAASAKAIQLSFASFSSGTSSTGTVTDTWMKEIEKRTNGRVKFNRF